MKKIIISIMLLALLPLFASCAAAEREPVKTDTARKMNLY
jgi:PBP1b-binding outer membrane lipoprotein LpoB